MHALVCLCILIPMRRRTSLVFDESLLTDAQEALGTTGVSATVEEALREAIRAKVRRELGERLSQEDGLDWDAMSDKVRRENWS